ncbi:hypothetical protein MKX03_036685 [Papaver bracteatum]|nr:hypothetical protein MKX03_036685 [Papaver bracteatum]
MAIWILELQKWQLRAEFQNVVDSASAFEKPSWLSASILWNQQRGEGNPLTFALGYNSDLPQFNSSKVWEFDEAHQRWYRLQSWHWWKTRVIKFILLLGHPILAGHTR